MNKFSTILIIWVLWILLGKFVFGWDLLSMVIGFGMVILLVVFGIVIIKLKNTRSNELIPARINLIFDISKYGVPLYYAIYAIYTTFLLVLTDINMVSLAQNMLWLILTIFAFQITPIFISLLMISKNCRPKHTLYAFLISYLLLSIMFGWTSAQLSNSKLFLPTAPDLLISTFIPIFMLIVFYYLLDYIKRP